MDSDREGSSAAPESSKGKSRQQSTEMPEEETYYTVILDDEVEPGSDSNARITLLNQRTRAPLSVITTEEEFLFSVQKFTSPWLDAILGLTNSFFNLRDENVVLTDDLTRLRGGSRQYKELANQAGEKVKQVKVELAKEVENAERLRQLRDKYRSEAYELREKTKVLQEKLDSLTSNDGLSDQNPIIDSDNEDNFPPHLRTSRSIPSTANRSPRLPKSQTPASTVGTTIQVGNNKKYPDVPIFYGNADDREKWEGWRLHLESKFRQSTVLYTCEQDKIDYIRDHCKDTAFEVIKTKANPTSVNSYLNASEMIQDLENMFGEFDKVAKSDVLLYSPKFGMAVSNPKETFDEFLARFTSAIALLDFTDRHKISNLRRTLSERLRFKMADGTTYSSFSQYVSRCRQCDLDLRQADGFSNRNRNDKSKLSNSNSHISGQQPRRIASQLKNLSHYQSSNTASIFRSGQLKQRLIKEGRCFRCGKKGHLATDTDALCKNQAAIPDQQLVLDLKAVELQANLQQYESDSEN